MEPLETANFKIVDQTEDYVSSALPTLILPQYTAIIGPFIANVFLLHRHCTDDQAMENKGHYMTNTGSMSMLEIQWYMQCVQFIGFWIFNLVDWTGNDTIIKGPR